MTPYYTVTLSSSPEQLLGVCGTFPGTTARFPCSHRCGPSRTQTRSYQSMRRLQRRCTTGLLGAISWFQIPRSSGTGFNLGEGTRTHSRATKLKSWEWATWVFMPTHLTAQRPSLCLLITTWLLCPSAASTHHGSLLVPVQALDGEPPAHSDCPRLLFSEHLLRPPAALWCPNSPDSSEGGYLISSTHTRAKATYSSRHTVGKWGSQDLNVHLPHVKVQFFPCVTQGGDRYKPSTSVAFTSNLGLKTFAGRGVIASVPNVYRLLSGPVSPVHSAVTHTATSVPQALEVIPR